MIWFSYDRLPVRHQLITWNTRGISVQCVFTAFYLLVPERKPQHFLQEKPFYGVRTVYLFLKYGAVTKTDLQSFESPGWSKISGIITHAPTCWPVIPFLICIFSQLPSPSSSELSPPLTTFLKIRTVLIKTIKIISPPPVPAKHGYFVFTDYCCL